MNRPIVFVLASVLPGLVASSSPATTKPPLHVVQGQGYAGVIFPAERGSEALIPRWPDDRITGYWTPTEDIIADLERELRQVMTAAADDAQIVLNTRGQTVQSVTYSQGEIRKIVAHYDEYRHQYVGILLNGERRVFINCFGVHESAQGESPAYWREQFVVVDDGGFWYWHIEYDPIAKKFLEFRSNGYA
jgi:hypothetical protein